MKKFILIVCLLSWTTVASASVDPDGGVKYNAEERVINLPRDSGQWYLTIFGDKNDPKFQLLKYWIQTHPGLANLRSQVHLNIYPTDNIRFKRYEPTLPGTPCIRLQTSDGTVSSEFWDEYIPMSPDALYQGIRGDISDKASWGCMKRRRCRPKPQPTPEPVPTPTPKPIDTPPVLTPEPVKPSFPWLLACLSALTGCGIGVAQGYNNEHIDTSM